MALFDFVKEAGEKLFDVFSGRDEAKEQQASKKMSDVVAGLGLDVAGLEVSFKDGVATVGGTAASQEEKEKVLLAIGNTKGVAKVEDRIQVKKAEPEARFYTVKSGDTLSKIAKTEYGNANKYMVIFEANKPLLKDPNKIYPGQSLRIPPLQ